MSLEQIKAEVAGMPLELQNHLAAYLVHLRHQRDPEIRRDITNRNADTDASKWIPLDELRKNWNS